MRLFLFVFVFIHITFLSVAQKKMLDYAASDNWPVLKPIAISNNGEYAVYSVSSKNIETMVVQSLSHLWKKDLLNVNEIAFTPDSRMLIFINKNDSLGILDLDKDATKYFTHVKSFRQPEEGTGRWLSFLSDKPEANLSLLDLFSGEVKVYADINDYIFDKSGKILILQSAAKTDPSLTQSVVWIDLVNRGFPSTIAHVLVPNNYVFDDAGSQLAFFSKEYRNGMIVMSIKYYRKGMDSALTIVDPTTSGMDGMILKSGNITFSKDGDKLFFRIKKPDPPQQANEGSDPVLISIRNYQHEILKGRVTSFLATVHLINNTYNVIRIEDSTDCSYCGVYVDENGNGNYALVTSFPAKKTNLYEPNDPFRKDFHLVSTKDGSRKCIISNAILAEPKFSLSGKYVIWYNMEDGQWTTYRVADGHMNVITKKIQAAFDTPNEKPNGLFLEEGLAGWFENDKAVLIYDRYDIWMVDPDGIQSPVNLTSGFGRRNNICLRYLDFSRNRYQDFNNRVAKPVRMGDTLILSAFNVLNKDNGFFKLMLGKSNGLKKLTMSTDVYYYPYRFASSAIRGASTPLIPMKARSENRYIVQRMNVNKYPNLYYTSDFVHYELLTNLEPQKNYLWYTSELIHFPLPNGSVSEGILYKPENFDSTKRYPLIFYYYERNADALHFYLSPEPSNGALNIPWFVSNGYLVFVPDIINYKLGEPGECAFQAVNSAADVLSRMSWVDAQKMGLQGHSYGGWETNYIVTHTGRFAAAAPGAGVSDVVSCNAQCDNQMHFYERGQGRMAASFWIKPERYVLNSPVFRADKVSTPILIMHNSEDRSVPFMQATEWFNNLSRLHKRVWLLSYAGEGHTLEHEKNQLDYSIRIAQFFDHYLKGMPAPKWMTGD